MENNKSVDRDAKIENKKIEKLLDFLKEFKKACENKSKQSSQVNVKGHIVWKETSESTPKGNKDKKNNENLDENFIFESTEFDFSESSFKELASVNISKIESLMKRDEIEFKINQRLPQDSYGCGSIDDFEILQTYMDAITNEITTNRKKGLIKTDKFGNKKIKEGTSLAIRFSMSRNGKKEEATFISIINLRNVLKKSNGKYILDLDKKIKSIGLSKNKLIIELDHFNFVTFGSEIFIINTAYFFYLFMPTKNLLNEIKKNRSNMEKSIEGVDYLIDYAEKNAVHTRELYYFVSKGSKIPDREEIDEQLEIMKKTAKRKVFFTLDKDNRIICTEENAKLIMSYISEKLGLRFSDKEILNLESVSKV